LGSDAAIHEPRIRAAAGGFVLDAGSAVLRRQQQEGGSETGPALAAARHYDDARSEFDSGVPVWVNVSSRAASAWRGPAGSRDRIARTGNQGESGILADV